MCYAQMCFVERSGVRIILLDSLEASYSSSTFPSIVDLATAQRQAAEQLHLPPTLCQDPDAEALFCA